MNMKTNAKKIIMATKKKAEEVETALKKGAQGVSTFTKDTVEKAGTALQGKFKKTREFFEEVSEEAGEKIDNMKDNLAKLVKMRKEIPDSDSQNPVEADIPDPDFEAPVDIPDSDFYDPALDSFRAYVAQDKNRRIFINSVNANPDGKPSYFAGNLKNCHQFVVYDWSSCSITQANRTKVLCEKHSIEMLEFIKLLKRVDHNNIVLHVNRNDNCFSTHLCKTIEDVHLHTTEMITDVDEESVGNSKKRKLFTVYYKSFGYPGFFP
uniref:Uncharacterized protein n=1 Tax=Panagrolaimus sp. JU765 TaxID=591449 RepID=A0AC34QSN6_9BILA